MKDKVETLIEEAMMEDKDPSEHLLHKVVYDEQFLRELRKALYTIPWKQIAQDAKDEEGNRMLPDSEITRAAIAEAVEDIVESVTEMQNF